MQPFLEFLIRSTLLLLIGGTIVGSLLYVSGCRLPKWNRFAWGFVLLLGIACVRLPVELPLLTPEPNGAWAPRPHPDETWTPPPQNGVWATRPHEFESTPKTEPASVSIPVASQPIVVEEPQTPQRTWSEFFTAYAIELLFAVWATGAALFFAAQLFYWFRAVRQANDTSISDAIFLREWNRLLADYGIDSRRIELRIVEHHGPGLLRLFTKYVVVVPEELWEEAPDHVRLGILKHELSHYRHGDLFKSFVLRTITLLHWFNPVAHHAVRKFDEAAEWRCDAEAFGANEDATSDFAETMLLFRDTTPVVAVYRTAFCGNNIKLRAERLNEFTQGQGDSLMKKIAILTICTLLLLFGAVQIKLTTRSVDASPAREAAESLENEDIRAGEAPALQDKTPAHQDGSSKTIPPEMKVVVKNEAGEPVKDVGLELSISWPDDVFHSEKTTDENGTAILDLSEFADKNLNYVALWVIPKEKYIGQFFVRNRVDGQVSGVPPEQIFIVKPGAVFGGTVVNEQGQPIPDAGINKYYQVDTGFVPRKTNAEGKWSVDTAKPDCPEYKFQISHPDYLDLDVNYKQGTPELERLRKGTERFVMKKGYNISGKVVDSDGKPIADAKVELGHQNRGFYQQGKEYYQETKTDSEGKYVFPSSPGGSKNLIVSAPGKAPQIRQLEIKGNLEVPEFQLKPGNTIQFKVVDAEGKPIEGAYVSPYSWQGSEEYIQYWKLGLKTDANGFCQWTEAPEGNIGYFIGKRGMIREKDVYDLAPRKEPYTITLYPEPIFSGTVVDKDTKKPIPNFNVTPGAKFDETYTRMVWQKSWSKPGENGRYTCPVESHAYALGLRVEADGYLPAETEAFVGVHGVKTVDFELTPAEPIHGLVLLPDGKPADGAEVRLIDSSNGREDIIDNDLKTRMGPEYQRDYLRTQSDGKFSFRPRKEGYVIVCTHEKGCALVFRDDLNDGTITLKPWARVELTLMKGKQPRIGQPVSLFGGGYSCGAWDPEKPMPLFQMPYVSDANGKVVAEKVFPDIPYWIEMNDRKFGRSSVDHYAPQLTLGQTQILPESGKTSIVQIGGVGCPVIGKVSLPDSFRDKIQWDYAKISLSSVDPTKPKPDYANLPIPKEIDRNDRTAVLRWFYKWESETDEGKSFKKLEADYNMSCDEETGTCPIVPQVRIEARINADGTFRVEDVTPGTYKVSFESFQPKPGNEIKSDDRFYSDTRDTFENTWTEPVITVPSIPGKQSDKPFDTGTIRIEL